MILPLLIVVLVSTGALAWWAGRWSSILPRWLALSACAFDLGALAAAWSAAPPPTPALHPGDPVWMVEYQRMWIPEFGVRLHFAADGLSFVLVALTLCIGMIAIVASFSDIREGVGFFHLNICWILAGIIGVFTAVDLFLFYSAWELMLVPMYFLIALWGHERRVHAAVKFFLFTQLSGLLMLIAILALYFLHHKATGTYTFDYVELAHTALPSGTARWIALGFFAAFAVKLPMFPFHTWLPDAHTEAPTAGSVILAGLLLKTGAYGLIRFVLPMFGGVAREMAPAVQIFAVFGILYGAAAAFAQSDLKRLVAYTSVSHLGFVLLGIFAGTPLALEGALIQMVAHALSTGALFVLVGALQTRLHTRDLARMGGLWAALPRLGGAAMFFAMASLGLPGLGDFVGELFVLLGAFSRAPTMASIATLGLAVSTVYGLKFVQGAFHGRLAREPNVADMNPREWVITLGMAVALLWIGLRPSVVLRPLQSTLAITYPTANRTAASVRSGP